MAEKITYDTVVSTTELASVLGLSSRRVQQLQQNGDFVAASRGHYNLCECVQRYIANVSKRAIDEDEAKVEKAKRMSEAQIKASKATIAKLEAEELKGKMHRAEDVSDAFEELIYTMRGALNALPGRVAVDVAAATSAAEAADIIRKEVFKVMKELSGFKYDPEKYAEKVRSRRNWGSAEEDDD